MLSSCWRRAHAGIEQWIGGLLRSAPRKSPLPISIPLLRSSAYTMAYVEVEVRQHEIGEVASAVNFQAPLGNLISMARLSALSPAPESRFEEIDRFPDTRLQFDRGSSRYPRVSESQFPPAARRHPWRYRRRSAPGATSGCMSGNRRSCASTDGIVFLGGGMADALSRIADKLVNPRHSAGMEISYMEIGI